MPSLTVNDRPVEFRMDPQTPLLWALRDAANLTGTKYGCGVGDCGACMVLVDGEALRSCLISLAEAEGRRVTTIEALSREGPHPVQQALVASESSLKVRLELDDLKGRFNSLSDRQRDTMQLLIRGLSNKEIGQQLGISPRTVEIHRTWVMTKMSARSIADLVRMGMALGIE